MGNDVVLYMTIMTVVDVGPEKAAMNVMPSPTQPFYAKTCLKCSLTKQAEDLSKQLCFVAPSITYSTNLANDMFSYLLTRSEKVVRGCMLAVSILSV